MERAAVMSGRYAVEREALAAEVGTKTSVSFAIGFKGGALLQQRAGSQSSAME